MTRAELNKLAARVEALQGPCRETNWAIMEACGVGPRDYTGSLDAAWTLATKQIAVGHESKPAGRWYARHGDGSLVWAATPALALCAAALRARAAIADADGGK